MFSCLLCAVCCELIVDWCSLSDVPRWLFVVCCSLIAMCCLFIVCCLSFGNGCLLAVVPCSLLVACCVFAGW